MSASTTDPPARPHEPYPQMLTRLRHLTELSSALRLLDWDQRVMMPRGAALYRPGQRAALADLVHQQWADPVLGRLLEACVEAGVTDEPDCEAAVTVREVRRLHERARCVPDALARELAEAQSRAMHAWQTAKAENDFAQFRPALEKLLPLARQRAECLGWPDNGEPWDALAADFEPGCTAKQVAALFDDLAPQLRDLLASLQPTADSSERSFTHPPLDESAQFSFMRHIATRFGFDFERGRLDATVHPFCARIVPGDVRLTVRYRRDDLRSALGSIAHETGHGLYEQGLPETHFGTPLCEPASLGIHESQSRLWENHVARSHAFCQWCAGELPQFFGEAAQSIDAEALFGALNQVEPTLVRTDADELTYHLHIMVRFELERGLLRDDLSVRDLPEVWARAYREQLGISVPDDARGCLQDIHWSTGAFGYFPSYTLGSLYAAQFFEAAEAALGDLSQAFAEGECGKLLDWLRVHVHQHGRRYPADVLCQRVTGQSLSTAPLMRHLAAKLRPLYAGR